MMTVRISNKLPLLIPVSIIAPAVVLINHPAIDVNDTLAMGIIYDLTLTSPILYLIAIWKSKMPKLTAVPVFVLGVVIATTIIPENQQFHLDIIKNFVLPIIELSVVGLIIYKIRQGSKAFSKTEESDFFARFKKTAQQIIPDTRVANVLTTEVAMIYYSLINWKKEIPIHNQFTYHKENGSMALMFALIIMVLVETVALHFLLMQWSPTVAWVLFVLSLYTALQLLGHAKAMKRRFIEVTDSELILKYGLFGDATVPLELIGTIELTSKDLNENESQNVVRLSLLGAMESHNCILHLTQPVTIVGAYGLRKVGTILLLHVDEKTRFVLQVQS